MLSNNDKHGKYYLPATFPKIYYSRKVRLLAVVSQQRMEQSVQCSMARREGGARRGPTLRLTRSPGVGADAAPATPMALAIEQLRDQFQPGRAQGRWALAMA